MFSIAQIHKTVKTGLPQNVNHAGVNKMAIKIFYHVAQMNGRRWVEIVKEQIEQIEKSGLANEAEAIYICHAGRLRYKYPSDKYQVRYVSRLKQYEFPALIMAQEFTEREDKILYIHTKGVSKITRSGGDCADKWRRYMAHYTVDHWRRCVEALDNADVVGVQYTKLDPEFRDKCGDDFVLAGNFWWSRGDYLLTLPKAEVSQNRWFAESWILKNNPKIIELHNCTGGEGIRWGAGANGPNDPYFCEDSYKDQFNIKTIQHKRRDIPIIKEEQNIEESPKCFPVKTRTDIINALIKKYGYNSYLEIGVRDGNNFDAIIIDKKYKTGVDPCPHARGVTHRMTSDDFFMQLPSAKYYDLIFIDGLHKEAQVERDIINALAHLTPGGAVVVHDCLPETEYEQRFIADPLKEVWMGVWTGDGWRTWARLRMMRNDLDMYVVHTDHGVGVIRIGGKNKLAEKRELTWKNYYIHRNEMMNIISPFNFTEKIK